MSSVKRKVRRLERYRKTHKSPAIAERQGKGKLQAREATALSLKTAMQLKKASNKLVKELDSLSVAELEAKVKEARQELFNLRFKHATGQLENVAALSATKRQIARILTLIKQKEVGA